MKKKHYLLFLLASLFLLTDVVWAQTSATVNGVVIDENGETLPGVSVVEVGTTNGVLTDLPFLSVTLVIRPPRFP